MTRFWMILGLSLLTASVRGIAGSDGRALRESVSRGLAGQTRELAFDDPERIRARPGSRLSCAEIVARILPGPSRSVECGAAGRVPNQASLEVVRKFWDPATKSWGWVVRCSRPADCVPFLVRVPEAEMRAAGQATLHSPPGPVKAGSATHSPAFAEEEFLVRAGEVVRLIWDQGGIRLVVNAVCLDRGREGQIVGARVARTGRVFRAIVVAPGWLRAQS